MIDVSTGDVGAEAHRKMQGGKVWPSKSIQYHPWIASGHLKNLDASTKPSSKGCHYFVSSGHFRPTWPTARFELRPPLTRALKCGNTHVVENPSKAPQSTWCPYDGQSAQIGISPNRTIRMQVGGLTWSFISFWDVSHHSIIFHHRPNDILTVLLLAAPPLTTSGMLQQILSWELGTI